MSYDEPHGGNIICSNTFDEVIKSNPDIEAFSSHQVVPPLPESEVFIFPIVFIRHPIDRARSAYLFEWQKQLGLDSPKGTFSAYIEEKLKKRRQNAIEDFQTLRLSNDNKVRFQNTSDASDSTYLERAKKFISDIPCVGVVDRFEESTRVIQQKARGIWPEFELLNACENVSQSVTQSVSDRIDAARKELGEENYQTLLRANRLDLELYEFANGLLDQAEWSKQKYSLVRSTVKSTNASAPMCDRYAVVGGSVYTSDAGIARNCVEQGNLAMERNLYLSAEQCALGALAAKPDYHPAFRLLGRAMEARHQESEAISCYRGNLPEALGERLGFVPLEVSDFPELDCKRIQLDRGELNHFQKPDFTGQPPRPEFSRSEFRSEPTWVDVLNDGIFWHDSHNTLVCDRNRREIVEHRMGNATFVNGLADHKPSHVGKRVILLGARGCGNYYHWMTDIIPKLGMLQKCGFEFDDADIFVLPRFNTRFQKETLAAFGVTEAQIYQTSEQTPWLTADVVLVPYLRNTMALTMGQWVPEFLQHKFLNRLSGSDEADKKLFIARDPLKKGVRLLDNYDEVAAEYRDRGYKIVFAEDFTVSQQAALFEGADVVAAPHGAGLTNILFCRPGTRVVEFFGDHIAPCYWAISNLLGLDYIPVDCRTEKNMSPATKAGDARSLAKRREQGFKINIESLPSC